MAKQSGQVQGSQTNAEAEPDRDDIDEEMMSDVDLENDRTEPSHAQLERARTEAEKALKELERQGAGDSTLSRYFREMANHRVLTPAEEIEAAQLVERLEIEYWLALFSYPSAFETVATVIEKHVEQVPPDVALMRKLAKGAKAKKLGKNQQQKWDEVSKALGTKMRELDSDRIFVQQSDKAVHRLAGAYADERDLVGDEVRITSAFKTYLEGIERARRAQQRSKNRLDRKSVV